MSISKDSAGREAAVALRNFEFHRPLDHEIPHELLAAGCATLAADELREVLDPDYTRVASRIEPARMVGGYSMRRLTDAHFELLSLSVLPELEHQLLGRRLLGHALGLAESKAGRLVTVSLCRDNQRAIEVITRYGFVPNEPHHDANPALIAMSFELTPE